MSEEETANLWQQVIDDTEATIELLRQKRTIEERTIEMIRDFPFEAVTPSSFETLRGLFLGGMDGYLQSIDAEINLLEGRIDDVYDRKRIGRFSQVGGTRWPVRRFARWS